jgi:hypothetical protein
MVLAECSGWLTAQGYSCPASRSWQDFFSFEVGDGGVGQAQVHLHRSVPGDRLVGADLVVLGAVVLGAGDQFEGVVLTAGSFDDVGVTGAADG